MNWNIEWNDLQNIYQIIRRTQGLSKTAREKYYLQIERKRELIFGSLFGQQFMQEYKKILCGHSNVRVSDIVSDLRKICQVIETGNNNQTGIWDKLYIIVVKRQMILFDSFLGEIFRKIFDDKMKLEKSHQYQQLEADFKKIEKIYKHLNFKDYKKGSKFTEELSNHEKKIFQSWMGHSFIGQLQEFYFSEKYRKSKHWRIFIQFLIGVLGIGMVSCITIGVYDRVKSADKLNSIRERKHNVINEMLDSQIYEDEIFISSEIVEEPQILKEYRSMESEYPCLFGWIRIPDTTIDYPVMQSKEDGFYLEHDFTGEASQEGALFVDGERLKYPTDNMIVVYGHNMKNGHMFGQLKEYENEEFFANHNCVYFDTIYEKGIYEIVAVLKTRILYQNEKGFRYYQTSQYNKETFCEFENFVNENKIYRTDKKFEFGDVILLLSTCEYSQKNGRLVIAARKIK